MCGDEKMKYDNIKQAVFIERLNRFVAKVKLDGEEILCHVKNTGRCREILVEGAKVYLEKSDNTSRKYTYSLISVYKGDRLINIDSSAPNKAVGEWLEKGGLFKNVTLIKPEKTYGKSRFDFYVEYEGKKAFIEVKGVTLEKDGVLMFPDAPTQRGSKHLLHLCECVKDGYEAYALFVIQTDGALYFTSNGETDKAFAENLRFAHNNGVKLLAYDCTVGADSMKIRDKVEIRL